MSQLQFPLPCPLSLLGSDSNSGTAPNSFHFFPTLDNISSCVIYSLEDTGRGKASIRPLEPGARVLSRPSPARGSCAAGTSELALPCAVGNRLTYFCISQENFVIISKSLFLEEVLGQFRRGRPLSKL